MKPLTPPSMRERRRYLVFEMIYDEGNDEESARGEREELIERNEERKGISSWRAEGDERKSNRGISERALLRAILDAMYSLYGDVGVSECGIWLIDYDEKKGVGILRCAHSKVDAVRAAFACIHAIDGKRTCIRVVTTSGTIKAAKRRFRRIKPFRLKIR